jgi:hypothetical protein
LLLEVREAKQWLLFDGDIAANGVGQTTAAWHRENARAVLHVRELAELPKILAEKTRGSVLEPVCTGSLVHDEHTPCPVHDQESRR